MCIVAKQADLGLEKMMRSFIIIRVAKMIEDSARVASVGFHLKCSPCSSANSKFDQERALFTKQKPLDDDESCVAY